LIGNKTVPLAATTGQSPTKPRRSIGIKSDLDYPAPNDRAGVVPTHSLRFFRIECSQTTTRIYFVLVASRKPTCAGRELRHFRVERLCAYSAQLRFMS